MGVHVLGERTERDKIIQFTRISEHEERQRKREEKRATTILLLLPIDQTVVPEVLVPKGPLSAKFDTCMVGLGFSVDDT